MSAGIVVFAHGSRVEAANEAVRAIARDLAAAGSFERVEAAFLELGKPDLAEAVERLVAAGVSRVVIIPYFLTFGLHLKRDVLRLAAELDKSHKDIEIRVTDPLDGHPGLVGILLDRAQSGLR